MYCSLSSTKPVLIVGTMAIEYIVFSSHFPVEGTQGKSLKSVMHCGGNASNVATVLRVLDVPVEFFGMLSKGAICNVVMQNMKRRDISTINCPKTDDDPPFSTILVAQDTGARAVINCGAELEYVSVKDFQRLDLSQYGWVHFEARNFYDTVQLMRVVLDFNNGREEEEKVTLSLGFTSIEFDPFFQTNLDIGDMCDYLVYTQELALQHGWQTPREACFEIEKALRLRRDLNLHRPAIVCPWGSEGAGCLDASRVYAEVPNYPPKKIVDTVGASDCFEAAFIFAIYRRQSSLAKAVEFAKRVEGHKLSMYGFDHIVNMNFTDVTPLTVDVEASSDGSSQDGDLTEEQRICRKYLNRTIKHKEQDMLKRMKMKAQAEAEDIAEAKAEREMMNSMFNRGEEIIVQEIIIPPPIFEPVERLAFDSISQVNDADQNVDHDSDAL
ncbi:ketohexokinase-like [Scaptodrosophila lebanonensis]|uniref:Ketohexokinase-like n=1 Tax=Drosophila lebanonensis TaxID=7225 RepID=A0A6J2T2Y0_DROLE|nr:ketohexokinase-like [Scaptodrosophila lebanonensis]